MPAIPAIGNGVVGAEPAAEPGIAEAPTSSAGLSPADTAVGDASGLPDPVRDGSAARSAKAAQLPIAAESSAPPTADAAGASHAAPLDNPSQEQSASMLPAPADSAADVVAEAIAVADGDAPAGDDAVEPPLAAAHLGEQPSATARLPNGAVAQDLASTNAVDNAADAPPSDGRPVAEPASVAAEPEDRLTEAAAESPHGQPGLADLLANDSGDTGIVSRKPVVGTTTLSSLTQLSPAATDKSASKEESPADGPRSSEANTGEDGAADVPGRPPLPRPDSSKALPQQQSETDGPQAGGLVKPDKLHMVGSIPDMSAAWKAKVAVSDETQARH